MSSKADKILIILSIFFMCAILYSVYQIFLQLQYSHAHSLTWDEYSNSCKSKGGTAFREGDLNGRSGNGICIKDPVEKIDLPYTK